MSTLEFRVAIRDAIAEEMERDESVIFFGEDVAVAAALAAPYPEPDADAAREFAP